MAELAAITDPAVLSKTDEAFATLQQKRQPTSPSALIELTQNHSTSPATTSEYSEIVEATESIQDVLAQDDSFVGDVDSGEKANAELASEGKLIWKGEKKRRLSANAELASEGKLIWKEEKKRPKAKSSGPILFGFSFFLAWAMVLACLFCFARALNGCMIGSTPHTSEASH